MRFDYRIVPQEPHPVPLVELLLYGPRDTVVIPAVVDSGAVRPIFPRQAADDAGIALPASPNSRIQYGIGPTRAWLARAEVSLGERRWRVEVSFVERLELGYALLGRRGVFGQFNEVAFAEKVAVPQLVFRW
jgi:hypothetical protein